jgi:uncharacterized Zn-binding protein involved in type VI secretion
MTDTSNLGLPCIEGNQAQKHVTHNEALRVLDTLVQLAVLDRDLTAPPGSPAEGQRWIVKAAGTGARVGHNNAIAAWQDGAWQFSTPQAGWMAFVADEGTLVVWNGSAWGDFFSTVTSLQHLSMLGLGTMADTTNRLSAKLNNALWTAKTVAEGGDGNLRNKLSKESAAKTVSLLMQDNFSGRAEFGLTGDDDFHFKVSPDGTTWFEGIKIAAATGAVTFPNTTIAGGRELLTANRTYYVRTDGSNSNNGLANTSGGAFLTIQKAIDTVLKLDLGGYAVTIQVGGGRYTAGVLLTTPFVGGNVTVQGDTTTPTNVVISTAGANAIYVANKAAISVQGFKLQTTTSGNAVIAEGGATIKINGKMEYGAAVGFQLYANGTGSQIVVSANYTISGSAAAHWGATDGGNLSAYPNGLTITLSGTPAFSNGFAYASRVAGMTVWGHTFSGSATGTRYSADTNSVVFVNGGGATYLPGNSAGSTASGGQYV